MSAPVFKVGDFDALPNLLTLRLRLNGDNEDRPKEFGPGIFQDLQSLKRLEMNNDSNRPTIKLTKDAFSGLQSLSVLDIEYVETIPEGALDHLKSMKILNISYLKGDIPARAFDNLQSVESISISTYKEETLNPRTLPNDFLKNLPNLLHVSISSEYLPDTMEVNSYETACQIESWDLRNEDGDRIIITVDGNHLKVTNRTTDYDPVNERNVRICQFSVGDTGTKKVIIPLE